MHPSMLSRLTQAAADAYDPSPGAHLIESGGGAYRGFMRMEDGPLIAIRGTADIQDALIDGYVFQRTTFDGDIHRGFLEEFEAIEAEVFDFIRSNPKRPVALAGHSLGGAIATILAMELAKDGYSVSLVTLGSPRVGDKVFAENFNALPIEHVRVVHGNDIVPRLPKLDYRHVDGLLHLSGDGHVISPFGGFFGWLANLDQIIRSDLSGTAFADHKMMNYLLAVENYVYLQLKGGNP